MFNFSAKKFFTFYTSLYVFTASVLIYRHNIKYKIIHLELYVDVVVFVVRVLPFFGVIKRRLIKYCFMYLLKRCLKFKERIFFFFFSVFNNKSSIGIPWIVYKSVGVFKLLHNMFNYFFKFPFREAILVFSILARIICYLSCLHYG